MITKHKELYLSLSGQMTNQEQLPLLWAIDPFNKNPGEFAQEGRQRMNMFALLSGVDL